MKISVKYSDESVEHFTSCLCTKGSRKNNFTFYACSYLRISSLHPLNIAQLLCPARSASIYAKIAVPKNVNLFLRDPLLSPGRQALNRKV